ncbi:MAG: chorismate lyase [Georgfuchsia sp.]
MKHWTLHLTHDRRLAAWLAAGGSLTAHIRRAGHDFRVRRLVQRCMSALPEERVLLGHRRGVTVREVLLMEGDVPLVFAHSVVSQRRTRGPWRAVRGLGSRPLAELLFADRSIVRHPLHYRAVTAIDPLGQRILQALPQTKFPLWARRSAFYKRGAPLLVTEVFLPAICRLEP